MPSMSVFCGYGRYFIYINNMLIRVILISVLTVGLMVSHAQNPIIRNQFTADPTARVFNGRVYLFPSHDIISPVEPEKRWFSMADYHMFSSADLVEWTDHGVILSQEDVPWGDPKAYSMWAPDCVEHNGKYYFYFPDQPEADAGKRRGFGIGVAVAGSLFRPVFVPQAKPIAGVNGIDPCVMKAADGNHYMFWGGGGLVVARLKENMLELDGAPQRIGGLPDGFKEGPFAFERGGKYYLTYPWVRHDGGTECLAYAMADSPMGPYTYKGIIMKESATGCWTNHHSIVEFNGQWYLFYHHNDYSPSFDKNRSVCIDSLFFRNDGTIMEVVPTRRGVGVCDARKPVQLDRYSDIGGGASIEYNDTSDCFAGWKTVFAGHGAWVRYNRVDTKSNCAENVCLRVRTSGKACFVMRIGSYETLLDVGDTGDEWQERNISVRTMPEGIGDLMLTLKSGGRAEVDWISLTEMPREKYFIRPSGCSALPDSNGFIRRWMLLEPIDKPNRSNTVFTDSYLREHLGMAYYDGQNETLPKDGQQVTAGGSKLTWHAMESNRFNVKLFRFATGLGKKEYGVLFHAVTVIDSDRDIAGVRLAVGSNSASMWWIDGKEVLLLSGDRRMVKDDAVSPRLTLKKGRNVLRGAIINGPGMSDFCVRFINDLGQPVKDYRVTLE